ncbi:MAG: ABC transporter substrate-binding protein [Candidatus Bathyarchaeia archaeon]
MVKVSKKIVVLIIACVVVIAAVIGYWYYYTMFQQAVSEVRIGLVAPVTGLFAAHGEGTLWGAMKAVEDINKLGGVMLGGRRVPVRLIAYDDSSDPTKTSALATQLIEVDGVIAFVVNGVPVFANPASVIADRYKTPLVTVGPWEPWWAGGPYKYAWHIGFLIATPIPAGDPRAGKRGFTVMDAWFGFLNKFADQTNRKVAVLACDDADGRGWYPLISQILKNEGYTPYATEENFGLYPPGTTDFSSLVLRWKDAGCEILVGNLPGVDFGIFMRQAYTLGWKPKMIAIGRAALFYEEVAAWGGDLPLGVATEVWWDPSYPFPGIGDRTSRSLAEEWYQEKKIFVNRDIGWNGYAPVQVILQAIEKAGVLDKEKINEAIAELESVTIIGPIKFIPEMHSSPCMVVMGQWQKTDKPWVWECPIIYSDFPEIPTTAQPIFPIP